MAGKTHKHNDKSFQKLTFAASGDEMQLRVLHPDLREILIFRKNNGTLHHLPTKRAQAGMVLQCFPMVKKIFLAFRALPHRLV